jgi:probable rRNA maturation factor
MKYEGSNSRLRLRNALLSPLPSPLSPLYSPLSTLHSLMLSITVNNQQSRLRVDKRLLKKTVRSILEDAGIASAEIGVAVVDDSTIARVHAEFLGDDSPTDVLSFVLESSLGRLEGEIVASADTAIARAPEFHCTPEKELLLYVIHGALHLVGYDDTTPKTRKTMRKMERLFFRGEGRGERGE